MVRLYPRSGALCSLLRRRSLYPTELRAHKNLLYFNASCPFCQRRSSANTTNARSFRTGRLWEEGDNTKGDRAPACRLAGMSGGLLYRGSDGNGGQRPPSGPRPRLSALDLVRPRAASWESRAGPVGPARNTSELRRGDYSTSMSGLLNSPNSSSLLGISSGRGRATQVVFM